MRLIFLILLMIAVVDEASAKSRAPIRIAEGCSVVQKVVSVIVARALKKSGFKHEFVKVGKGELLDALENGRVHVQPAVTVTDHSGIGERIEAGNVRSLGGLKGNQQDEPILKLVWPGMKKKWPDAQKLLKRMILSNREVSPLVEAVETGTPVITVVNDWWKANPKTWNPWIAASKNWMKP